MFHEPLRNLEPTAVVALINTFQLRCLAVLVVIGLAACGESGPTDKAVVSELLPETAVAEVDASDAADAAVAEVAVNDATNTAESSAMDVVPSSVKFEDAERPFKIELLAEKGYQDMDGRLVIDVMQDDSVYLILLIEDAKGRLVEGAEPSIGVEGTSYVNSIVGHGPMTDASGSFRFGVVGGEMGEENVFVSLEDATASAMLNVISQAASGYGNFADIEGVLPWDVLMQADISWGEQMSAVFPPGVQAKHGKTVKLAGFMMPLEMTQKQSRFLLTSNPPSCFFHIPGGPAGAVEVFSAEPVDITWRPVVLEGRFETFAESEIGIAYRLNEATLTVLE